MVLAWRQRKSRRILNVFSLHLLRGIECQLHVIANISDDDALRVLDLPHHIDVRLIAVTVLYAMDLRARHNQRHRNEELVALQPEI